MPRLLAFGLTGLSSTTTAIAPPKTWSGRLVTKPPSLVTWLVDGTNLGCSRNVPSERQVLLEELEKIASPAGTERNGKDSTKNVDIVTNVVVVFDDHEEEAFSCSTENDWFHHVVTDGKGKLKNRADDYMVHHVIPELLQPLEGGRVHLVSADKELGKRVQASGIMKGGSIVHPPKFWKEYLPNLQQRQQQQQQEEKQQERKVTTTMNE